MNHTSHWASFAPHNHHTRFPRTRNTLLGVQSRKKDWKDCMAEKPDECESLRYALFHCRRGQIDTRTRIQGNKGY